MNSQRLAGLIAATYTPLGNDGDLNRAVVAPLVEHLLQSEVNGLYVCGSTGEGMSLASDERNAVAESYVHAADGRVPVIIQVGHNSLSEARQLAVHAQRIGADVVSPTCPSYISLWLHSCGDVRAILPDLIDVGLDVLQPLQVAASMDLRELLPQYGKDLVFFGKISAEAMSGPLEPLEEEIRKKLTLVRERGGYIYHSDHSIPPEVSFDRYQLVMQWVRHYGQSPVEKSPS